MKKFTPFTIKAASDGYTYIEGVANKAIVDRGNDLIDPKAWDLKNYQKNPVILYNHDRDKIIGRAVECKPQEDGLYIRCRISKSRDAMVSYVRDMIEEGMINAFSVGFSSKDAETTKDGVNTIKSAELYEVSVVSIPMNQDSLFEVSMKDLASAGNLKNVRRKFLESKAASESVLQLQDMLDAMEALGSDRETCILALCDASGLTRDEMRDLLAGDNGDIKPELLEEAGRMLDGLRENDGNDEAPEAKGKPGQYDEDEAEADPEADDGDKKPSTKKPKKSKKPPMEEPEDGEKSVAVPGNGSDMSVQTDVQAILTQNNVLIANLIGEVQKLNALMTQYLAAEEVEDQRDEDESGAPEDGGDGESAEAPEEAPATGGKISDADEAASKLVEMKLAEIKAVLERVKKTGPK
jgi:hypothetical protein